MDQSVTFVDVETPNHRNDCISSIGIINVDSDGVVTSEYFLVDPEAPFDTFNIRLTGITPEMVKGQSNFEELWRLIEKYFTNSLIVAHNALFDLSVITSCLNRYGLEIPVLYYACTYRMARMLRVPSSSYKLNDLSSYYHIDLKNHHNAMDDTKACMEIFYQLLQEDDFNELSDHIRQFIPKIKDKQAIFKKMIDELLGILTGIGFDNYLNEKELKFINKWLKNNKLPSEYNEVIKDLKVILKHGVIEHYQYLRILNQLQYLKSLKANDARSLYEFMSILEGISIDETISDEEIVELKKWMQVNNQFKGAYPFNQILTLLDKVLDNKQIDQVIEDELLYLIKTFFKPDLDQCEFVDIKDKVICLTGNFSFGQRSQLEKLIVLKQGIVSQSVTKKVDYLVLGSKGSAGYKYGKYGAKINKALMMKSAGHKIELLSEARLMEMLKSF